MNLKDRPVVPLKSLLLVGFTALLLNVGTVQAFYWKDWPGSRIKPPETILPDDPGGDGGGPPGGPFDPGPGGGPGDPKTPEPGTLLASAVGLALVGLRQLKRRHGDS